MRPGDIVAAIVVTIVAVVVLLLSFAGPACGCSRALPSDGQPSGLGGAARLLATAQAIHVQRHGAFARDTTVLGAVPLPDGIALRELRPHRSGYVAVLVETAGAAPHQCAMTGERPAADGHHRFTLDCREIAAGP